jgi:hypothetical protein
VTIFLIRANTKEKLKLQCESNREPGEMKGRLSSPQPDKQKYQEQVTSNTTNDCKPLDDAGSFFLHGLGLCGKP